MAEQGSTNVAPDGRHSRGPRPKVFSLIPESDVAKMPPPKWLIEDVLPENALAVMYGPSGVGKSFLAADWSFCLASGRAWAGHSVKQGSVVYVAAEGIEGFGSRIAAWKLANREPGEMPVHFLSESVQIASDQEVRSFLECLEAARLTPSLVVLDTLSRCFVGEDENSAKAMSRLVDAADSVRRATGATVLLIHHTTKAGDEERGSVALRSGLDAMMSLHSRGKRSGQLVLSCEKMRNAKHFPPHSITFEEVANSRVVRVQALGKDETLAKALSKHAQRALALLPVDGLTDAKWCDLFTNNRQGPSPRTFYRAKAELVGAQAVIEERRTFRPAPVGMTANAATPLRGDSMAQSGTATVPHAVAPTLAA